MAWGHSCAWVSLVLCALSAPGCGGSENELAEQLAAEQELRSRLEAKLAETVEHAEAAEQEAAAVREMKRTRSRLLDLEKRMVAIEHQAQIVVEQSQREVERWRKRFEALPLAARLRMRIDFKFKGTLDEALMHFRKLTTLPLRVESRDLGVARVPRNRVLEFDLRGQPAYLVLEEILLAANTYPDLGSVSDPKMALAYVIEEQDVDGRRVAREVVITSREREFDRGVPGPLFLRTTRREP